MTLLPQSLLKIPGWTEFDQLELLFNETLNKANTGIVSIAEVGSWCGRSSVAIGLALKMSGRGHLACIDLWPNLQDWSRNEDGSWSIKKLGKDNAMKFGYQIQTVWNEPFTRDILPVYKEFGSPLKAFKHFINHYEIMDYISIFEGTSTEWIQLNQDKLDGVFLDGDHAYQAVMEDLSSLLPRIKPSGFLIFDDAFSSYEGVDRAINESIYRNKEQFESFSKIGRKTFIAKLKKQDLS